MPFRQLKPFLKILIGVQYQPSYQKPDAGAKTFLIFLLDRWANFVYDNGG